MLNNYNACGTKISHFKAFVSYSADMAAFRYLALFLQNLGTYWIEKIKINDFLNQDI